MNVKMKELTEKIRQEGYEKTKIEAENIREAALNESEIIKNNTRIEDKRIISNAKLDSESYAERVRYDLQLSVEQSIWNLRRNYK